MHDLKLILGLNNYDGVIPERIKRIRILNNLLFIENVVARNDIVNNNYWKYPGMKIFDIKIKIFDAEIGDVKIKNRKGKLVIMYELKI